MSHGSDCMLAPSKALMTLGDALALIPGGRLVGDPNLQIVRVHSDTRSVLAGDLFVALRGERFDANDFLAEARQSGAVAAIAHGGLEAAGLPGIEVADTHAALVALSAGWREKFTLPLIAVTGSNGKTTVTQMIASILRAAHGDGALATRGNFNNAIGVPLTLLRLDASHRAAVVELGMNHPGEIAMLAHVARPRVALVNNAQREHQEFMGSVDAVAHENGAAISALPADGVAVFPAQDRFTSLWRSLAAGRRCITFGEDGAEVSGSPLRPDVALVDAKWHGEHWSVHAATPAGALRFTLHVAGRHNVINALAAAACALAASESIPSIAGGLSAFQPVKGRSRARQLQMGEHMLTLVDDSYNANPDSVLAAIDILASLPAPRLLVLGDMAEVGSEGLAFHAEVGAYARQSGIDRLLAFGPLSAAAIAAFDGPAIHFSDRATLLASLRQTFAAGNAAAPGSVLVKGSRSMQMEAAVEAIESLAADLVDSGDAERRPCC
jgi:UDP-N-acetylmuramoyl-tripeptide--D-alanyl-D-alanine ligase